MSETELGIPAGHVDVSRLSVAQARKLSESGATLVLRGNGDGTATGRLYVPDEANPSVHNPRKDVYPTKKPRRVLSR